jgi:glycosyltransferase involved in cell wall biosynthesis
MEESLRSQVSYWSLLTVKNGEKTISKSMESILNQSLKPSLICVVNDGSRDSTSNILEKLADTNPGIIRIITLEDKGYDIRRIVHNWNTACKYVSEHLKTEYDYLLITSDDVIFPSNYVENLIRGMETDPKVAIVSGSRGLEQSDSVSLPEGAGRIIRSSFFKQLDYRHPPYYGYEAWILYKALQLGYGIEKLHNVTYDHIRIFGVGHNFVEYGPAMRCLGYHPLFVLARVARNIFTGKTGISRRASVRMLFDYLFESRWKGDPYFQYFDPDLRVFVRNMQKKRLLKKLRNNIY